jgi:hypothetical protein
MHVNPKLFQRAILAFTTGLFLACSARISAAQQPRVNGVNSAERPGTTILQVVR